MYYPETWYRESLTYSEVYPILSAQSLRADTLVIGGGLAGLTTALECIRAGQSVVLLEAKRIGFGASGRNGGFVMAGFAEEISGLIRKVGMKKAKTLYQYSRDGVEYVRQQISTLDPAIKMGTGSVSVSRHPQARAFKQEAEFLKQHYGHPLSYWDTTKTRDHLRSDRYYDALYDCHSFHIHPLNYVHALAAEFVRLGGRLFEGSEVGDIDSGQGRYIATTRHGRIEAEHMVLCTSAYGRALVSKVAKAVLPVATHVVVSEPMSDPDHPINCSAAIADTRRAGDYYRKINDDRLLWGGKITTRRTPPRRLVGLMRQTLSRTYPELKSLKIDYGWSGLMGYALHKMPLIGELEKGLWVATAFGGHGLNTTAMAGCLVASGICYDDHRWRDFSDFKPRWIGGSVGQLGVQGSYWLMQARDYFEETRTMKYTR